LPILSTRSGSIAMDLLVSVLEFQYPFDRSSRLGKVGNVEDLK
jgi:hypothetical protein